MNRKTLISIVLTFVTLFTCILPVTAAETVKGDIDGDYTVTVNDARKCLRAAIGLETLIDAQKTNADIDLDGDVTVNDARVILRLSIGLEYSSETDKRSDEQKENEDGTEKSLDQQNFENVLYTYSHQFVGTAKSYVTSDFTGIAKNFQKWCSQYTMGDIIRPVLQKLGYSDEAMNKLAPASYSSDLWCSLMLHNNVGLASYLASKIASGVSDIYTPSLVMGYYQSVEKDGICKVFNFVDYYDNEITAQVKEADSADVKSYTPQVGDILFITNKNKFITGGDDGDVYNYIIHTAQIIKVNDDGTFLTTEGAIIEPAEGDGIARVREREYVWQNNQVTNKDAYGKVLDNVPKKTFSTYVFKYNSTVIVLAAVRPDWFGIK